MREVGELGESTLKLWASQADIVANKSTQDKTGWDFLLEFPLSRDIAKGSLPLDKDPSPLRVFVQVKSTDGQPGKWSVKLDNWVRFVKNSFPAFFLVLEFDSQVLCQRAYLVHVGEKYIRKVLKRLREMEVGKRSELHRRTMQFTYSAKDVLPSLDGWGLEQAIRRYVEGSMDEYEEKKLQLLKNVGYEDGYALLSVTMSLPPGYGSNIQEYLVDLSLGLVPHLEVTRGEMTDYRFGIAAPEPSQTFGKGGTLGFANKPVGKATIRLSTPDKRRILPVDTDLYIPQGFSPEVIEPQYYKIRLAAPFFNMVFWPDRRVEMKFTVLDIAEEYDILSLQTLATLILFIQEAGRSFTHIKYEVVLRSSIIASGQMSVTQQFDDETFNLVGIIDGAMNIARYFNLSQDMKVNPGELQRQTEQIFLMNIAIGSKQGVMNVIFWSEDKIPDDEKEFCVPFVTNVVIGHSRMIIGAAVIGRLETTDKFLDKRRNFSFTSNCITIARKYLYGHDEPTDLSAREITDSVAEEFEESHNVLLLEEFIN